MTTLLAVNISKQGRSETDDKSRIDPEFFDLVPADGLKFFALYQRYDSLGKAIAELTTAFEPCCLTHNDFTKQRFN